jgi:hypothetical protein
MTLNWLYQNILGLPASYPNQELELYLRALYSTILTKQEQEPSLALFALIFEEAFTNVPIAFNENWLQMTEPPDPAMYVNTSAINYIVAVLAFQIADLHKMKDKQLNDEFHYFGLQSTTGNDWYNFDPFTFLESGVRSLIDHSEEIEPVGWRTLGEIIEMGRIYE